MKSSLFIFCVLTCQSQAMVMPKSYYELDGSTDSECTLRDLKTERNLDFDFPMSKESPKCRLSWSELNQSVREDYATFVQDMMGKDGGCLAKEMVKGNKTMDLILIITSVQVADFFSESEKVIRLVPFQNEIRKELEQIATECHSSKDDFLKIFRGVFEYNETLVTMETNYCLGKYVTDNGILTLPDGVNLNPNSLNTTYLNCSIIVDEAKRKDEQRFRDNMTLRDQTAVVCVMKVYKENEVFYLDFADMVLLNLQLPEEKKQAERKTISLKRALLSFPFKVCYDMDKDYPYA